MGLNKGIKGRSSIQQLLNLIDLFSRLLIGRQPSGLCVSHLAAEKKKKQRGPGKDD